MHVFVEFTPRPESIDEIREQLALYPSIGDGWFVGQTAGQEVPQWYFSSFGAASQLHGIAIHWEGVDHESTHLDEVAPEYRYRDERWLRPAVGDSRDFLSPLMAWWALLYALSMLSRYHPLRWATALDIDESELAAEIEFVLRQALEAVPQLVLGAIWADEVVVERHV